MDFGQARLSGRQSRFKCFSEGAQVNKLFRKIAQVIHPDRKQDPEEKHKKTAAMVHILSESCRLRFLAVIPTILSKC